MPGEWDVAVKILSNVGKFEPKFDFFCLAKRKLFLEYICKDLHCSGPPNAGKYIYSFKTLTYPPKAMREMYEQSQAKTQEITTAALWISKPHDEAKNYYLRSITQSPLAQTTGIH